MIITIAAGEDHSLVLTDIGLFVFGDNSRGQLGLEEGV